MVLEPLAMLALWPQPSVPHTLMPTTDPMTCATYPTCRRWFQFGIGTMLAMTAIVAIWLSWELAFIRERQAWIRRYPQLVDQDIFRSLPPRIAHIPWWRRMLRDEAVPLIAELDIWDDNDHAYVARLFPEAEFVNLVSRTGTFQPMPGTATYRITIGPLIGGLPGVDVKATTPAKSDDDTPVPNASAAPGK